MRKILGHVVPVRRKIPLCLGTMCCTWIEFDDLYMGDHLFLRLGLQSDAGAGIYTRRCTLRRTPA